MTTDKRPLPLNPPHSSDSDTNSDHEHDHTESTALTPPSPRTEETAFLHHLHERTRQDARFNQPPPSPFKRAALLLFTALLFWLAFHMRKALWLGETKPQVLHAHRYSKEFKFRPAASPIVTETLKDGRIRVRGAAPTATPSPVATTKPVKKKRLGKKRAGKRAKPAKRGNAL